MLLGSHSVLNKSLGRNFGGQTVSNNRSNWGGASRMNQFAGGFEKFNGVPVGYRPPYAFVLPKQSGGLAASNTIAASGSITAGNLAGGLNAVAPLTGSGDITNAALALIVSAVAALTGSGALTANILGKLEAAAALAGSGNIAGSLGALADLAAGLTGAGTITAQAIAKAFMSADIIVTGDVLTAANVGPAVWSAIASANNSAGTMGEKLNDAGSASNPWTEVIESGYTAAEILRLLAAVMAGKSDGGGGTTIHFRDLGDTKDRIAATVDTNGNRSIVVKDAT